MGKKKYSSSYEETKKIANEKGIKSAKEYLKYYKELGLPSAPHITYKNSGWIDWPTFLCEGDVKVLTYEEAKSIARENGIKTKMEYCSVYKELGLPSAPARTYKNSGWVDWFTFLCKEEGFPSYEKAKSIIKERGINSVKKYNSSCQELGLPSKPHLYYKHSGWVNWATFLDQHKKEFVSYEEARRIVIDKGISSVDEYKRSFKSLCLPSAPDRHYAGAGWTSWSDFFGKDGKNFPSFKEAKRMVREMGIKTSMEYYSSFKKLGLPSNPDKKYSNEWISWADFLDKDGIVFPSYKEAREIVIDKGISSMSEYKKSYKSLSLPCNPNTVYGSEWVSWYDFLGKSKQTTQEDRKYNLFKKLAINPVLLKDAPLKVLYIYFSKFRGITDGISSLLATSSYEERLNWVKEQLNSLKDGSLSKDKSSEEPDELSAMKSVLEENDDVKESLSGEDAERFNILLENYVHSVVNRELISEVEDK